MVVNDLLEELQALRSFHIVGHEDNVRCLPCDTVRPSDRPQEVKGFLARSKALDLPVEVCKTLELLE